MQLSQAQSQSGYSMKPRGTNNAAENELTTPKSAFGKPISQCGLSTKLLKPSELSTPEKTPFQRVNRLLYQQTQRAEFQQKSSTQLTQKSPHQRTNQPLKQCQFWVFTTLVNTEIECRYDNLDFELLPLDLAI
ncbi:hypothetical protein QTV42_004190 [Vibrio vulnificus]|nr:hypothetical protein [Vibrio vulnificus]ELP6772719.1 hypothetical protein [Vibrio vulnificus]OKQ16152.1 hypothetical protein H058_19720 [Vibrio antiquarius]